MAVIDVEARRPRRVHDQYQPRLAQRRADRRQTVDADYPFIGAPDRRRLLRICRLEALLSGGIKLRSRQSRNKRCNSQTPARRAKGDH
jgi:hypothetical protein